MSRRILFNDGWEFCRMPLGTSREVIEQKNDGWGPVDLPHDWLIEDVTNLYADGEGWYRKWFEIEGPLEGSRISIRFDGIYMDSTVWVNGRIAGEWKYGYTTFELDITDLAAAGGNSVLVRVVYQAPNSRWYTGAGIYRNVHLVTRPLTHFTPDGIYVSAHEADGAWRVDVECELVHGGTASRESGILRYSIIDCRGNTIAGAEDLVSFDSGVQSISRAFAVESPDLWDLETPSLYILRAEIEIPADNAVKETDREEVTFGFRSIMFDPDRGFFLNGKRRKLNGVCLHHDLGCLGAAVYRAAVKRQLSIMKEMGVNAIRTSHNMPAVEVMECCDEMGILVCSESFDTWENPKNEYDYSRFFKEWHERDVAGWIRRDRNHPSVIMWCIGNEISDTHLSKRGAVITMRLKDLVEFHDCRGNAPVTIGSNYMPWENARRCADIVKLAGYNYGEKYYEDHHAAHPDWCIYGSETSSIVQSRGIYHFPAFQSILADDDLQCSSLGNSRTSWGARSVEECITVDRDMEFSAGQFLWSGFDYLGEPTPYHTKNSYFGQVDTCGFPKDAYYMYQSAWVHYKERPVLHIFPYWDFNEGQLIDIRVCSNAPRVELFFNDSSLGSVEFDHVRGKNILGGWQIPYTPGVLKALAYDETGRVIAEEKKSSFREPAVIILKPDKKRILADGRDLVFVEIFVVDAKGRAVENAVNRMNVEVTGAGRLLGLDNGDSTDYEQYKSTSRRLFSGKLLVVIGGGFESGTVEVNVSSPGLPDARITFEAAPVPQPVTSGASAEYTVPQSSVSDGADTGEIPLRKIELICPDTELNEKHSTRNVSAHLHPPDAVYRDLIWRVTDDAGIDSNIAAVEPAEGGCTVTAKGDGDFRLRCMSKNGRPHICLISELEYTVRGLGTAYLDPYSYISGGLYSYSEGEISNGNERGAATPRETEARLGYRGIDFGGFGSDELTVDLFVLDSDPFEFEIWEGIPGEEGSEKLSDAVYQKPSIWNTYQPETFKLSRRVQGISDIIFVTRRKAHIRGFSFTRLSRAFSALEARECDRIYGDSYSIRENCIENIGNNVTIEFDEMDFGANGADTLYVQGRSRIAVNSIRLQFTATDGETHVITVEVPFTEEITEHCFHIEPVFGSASVQFIFLPGCSFDFAGFRFAGRRE